MDIKGDMMGTAVNFYTAIEKELAEQKTLTDNGATAYESSGYSLLDMNFEVAALRTASEAQILTMWYQAYLHNKLLALRWLFYLRDAREGLGERRIFRIIMKDMATNATEVVCKLIPIIAEYGRYDDLFELLDTPVESYVFALIRDTWCDDMTNYVLGKPITLLSKWLPSENASSLTTKSNARKIRQALGLTPKLYRTRLSRLRAYSNVVEVKMCSGNWDKIDYSTVPSQANLKYKGAFLDHDEERRVQYLQALKKGDTTVKINARVLQPHEIVRQYGWAYGVNQTLEECWKALPQLFTQNVLVVRDGSGSMSTPCASVVPIMVATALAIYASEHTTDAWKNKFITFSARPKIVTFNNDCVTLCDKLLKCEQYHDCSNTNLTSTMRLILDTAVNNHMTQTDMPDTVLILSDMQFDAYDFNLNASLMDTLVQEYKDAGFQMPRLCFWNLAPRLKRTVPMQKNELGLLLVSGFSIQILKSLFITETDAYQALLATIANERYDAVEKAVEGVLYD